MVANLRFLSLLCLLLLPLCLHAQDEVKIVIELDKELISGRPIDGKLIVFHPKSMKINADQIVLEGNPLTVNLVSESQVPGSKDNISSTFRFQLPPKNGGLYVLNPITVPVNGKEYASQSIAYEVKGGTRTEIPVPVRGSSKGTILGLEAFVEGPKLLYPTQKTTFGYRYIFNDNIELTSDKLPLFDPTGFKKMGKQVSKDYRKGNLMIREVRQVVVAEKPGNYTFGPSEITGIAYTKGVLGQRQYTSQTLKATSPAIEIEVLGFPESGKPASFNGAIGEKLNFTTVVQGLSEVSVGDKLTLSLEIGGQGDLENVPMPELCCQPGFPGRFKLGDLPPLETMHLGKKVFVTDLIPLSIKVREIPAVEFSYYNPKSGQYHTLKSAPIQITVRPTPEGVNEIPDVPTEKEKMQSPGASDFPDVPSTPKKLEIEGIYSLSSSDLKDVYFGSWTALFILPLGFILLYVQYDLKKRREELLEKEEEKIGKSLMDKAIAEISHPDLFFSNLNIALLTHLYESGFTQVLCHSKEELPSDGIAGEVKQFLTELDEKRFSGRAVDPKDTQEKAKRLFDRINREAKKNV